MLFLGLIIHTRIYFRACLCHPTFVLLFASLILPGIILKNQNKHCIFIAHNKKQPRVSVSLERFGDDSERHRRSQRSTGNNKSQKSVSQRDNVKSKCISNACVRPDRNQQHRGAGACITTSQVPQVASAPKNTTNPERPENNPRQRHAVR
jgi:hypothetical protein